MDGATDLLVTTVFVLISTLHVSGHNGREHKHNINAPSHLWQAKLAVTFLDSDLLYSPTAKSHVYMDLILRNWQG